MGLFELFWDMRQEGRIRDAEATGDRHARSIDSVSGNVERLEGQLERMMLLNRALWELVSERSGITETELEDKVREVDLRDGKLDGHMAREVTICPKCRRANNKTRRTCLYCSTPIN